MEAIEFKLLESAERISAREITLNEFDTEIFRKYVNKIKKAIVHCKMANQMCASFFDPYYKMIQLNTYLYLAGENIDESKKEMEKNIDILNEMEYSGVGFLYAYRNYFEAIGDIEAANGINAKIKPSDKNDVNHITDLYNSVLSKMRDDTEL